MPQISYDKFIIILEPIIIIIWTLFRISGIFSPYNCAKGLAKRYDWKELGGATPLAAQVKAIIAWEQSLPKYNHYLQTIIAFFI